MKFLGVQLENSKAFLRFQKIFKTLAALTESK
jgi:hypothetical protein